MSELSLQRRAALHGIAKLGRFGAQKPVSGVHIREVKEFGAIAICARKGRADDVSASLGRIFDVAVADAPRRSQSGTLSITGVAPGQWLLVERRTEEWSSRLDELRRSLAGIAALSEQSDGKLIVDVSGLHARDTLAKGIAIDLDPLVFPAGYAAQTVVAHMNVQVSALGAGGYELVSTASTAGSFWSWLSSAAAEFGYEVS